MKLLRHLLVSLCAAAGLVVLTQAPTEACSCVAASTAEQVEGADGVFLGTLTEIEQTNPGANRIIGSGDPVFYTFDVSETFKGESGDGVVESVRFGATCGLEGMKVDQMYVVFAGKDKSGALDANLCGGTATATPRLIAAVDAAVGEAAEPASPTAVPSPAQPVPTQAPSGVEPTPPADGAPGWAWFAGGVLVAVVGGAVAMRLRSR